MEYPLGIYLNVLNYVTISKNGVTINIKLSAKIKKVLQVFNARGLFRFILLAGGGGFEPPLTDSESAVTSSVILLRFLDQIACLGEAARQLKQSLPNHFEPV